MKNLQFNKQRIDWERRQQFLLKDPKADVCDKVPNRKRAERFGGSYEDKQYAKYGFRYEAYIDETEEMIA